MTQKEKARAYDEALKRANGLLELLGNDDRNATVGNIKIVFPELADAEEDGVKGEIFKHFAWCEENGYASKEEVGRWKDWIEKNEKFEWEHNDKMVLEFVINATSNRYPLDMYAINWLKSLRRKVNWKPTKEQMNHLNRVVEELRRQHEISVGGVTDYGVLKSLYDNLKAL